MMILYFDVNSYFDLEWQQMKIKIEEEKQTCDILLLKATDYSMRNVEHSLTY
jgi:hypothetical protein